MTLLAALAMLALPGCSLTGSGGTLSLVSVFPMSGPDAALGLSMQRAVDLAVRQNGTLPANNQLSVLHVDEALGNASQVVASDIGGGQVVGVVGPMSSETALGLAPIVARAGVVTISTSAMLPGLTQADAAKTEGLTFTQIHPAGAPPTFLRLTQTSDAAGKAAADLAVAPEPKGLAASSFYVVDDGSPSGMALAASFSAELAAKQGTVLGHSTLVGAAVAEPGAVVAAIASAQPAAVFYAGATGPGAALRGALSGSGMPSLPLLTAGASADNAGWAGAVGDTLFAGQTTGILSAPDLSTLPAAKAFTSAYQSAYQTAPTPQAALAYDAAMDEIAAIKSVIAGGKTPTAGAVLAAVTSAKYTGVTGAIAFDNNGDITAPPPFSVYTCDTKGVWTYGGVAGT